MEHYDVVVVGSGPAGQKAAIQVAKAGRRVALVERERAVGGGCVHRGTIPSKTLRAAALQIAGVRRVVRGATVELGDDFAISNLMTRLGDVLENHENYWADQLERNKIVLLHGTAAFRDSKTMVITAPDSERCVRFDHAIIATGSRPRRPDFAEIDDEFIFDSDSVLAIDALPKSMLVLGAGVIAAEYASIFACLDVEVTMVDNRSRPIPFVDPELSESFLAAFRASGGVYVPDAKMERLAPAGAGVTLSLSGDNPRELTAASALVALGRLPNSDQLNLDSIGVDRCKRGNIIVDDHCFTGVGGIYAVGDVIGPPSLASTSMDQGRRAARAIVGLPTAHVPEVLPAGVYTIPEISCVGLSELEARERFGDAIVGRARYAEVARGCISGDREGLLKLIAEPSELRIVGIHIVGANAAELVHVGQVAMISGWSADDLIDNVFNFPTFAEAYRIAALDAAKAARLASGKADGVVRMKRASAAI